MNNFSINSTVSVEVSSNTTKSDNVTSTYGVFNLKDNDKILSMALGDNHTISLSNDGRVFSWGLNNLGQLGTNDVLLPGFIIELTDKFKLDNSDKIVKVSAGLDHSAAISLSGRVFTWGLNDYGQLGNGSFLVNSPYGEFKPVEITKEFGLKENEKIIELSLGFHHSLFLSNLGRLWGSGNNESFQIINDQSLFSIYYPILIPLENVIKIKAGSNFSSALTKNGSLNLWGDNRKGQLCSNVFTDRQSPFELNRNKFSLENEEIIYDIAAGSSHLLILTNLGSVFSCGENTFGQLGDGSGEKQGYGSITNNSGIPLNITTKLLPAFGSNKIINVFAGYNRSMATSSNGEVFAWGDNDSGQLGIGNNETVGLPKIVNLTRLQNTQNNFVNIYLGGKHSSFLNSNGQIYFSGKNNYGQIGFGDRNKVNLSPELFS
jgi:alpha-tubulin suppressor-like RCC1 family protein